MNNLSYDLRFSARLSRNASMKGRYYCSGFSPCSAIVWCRIATLSTEPERIGISITKAIQVKFGKGGLSTLFDKEGTAFCGEFVELFELFFS